MFDVKEVTKIHSNYYKHKDVQVMKLYDTAKYYDVIDKYVKDNALDVDGTIPIVVQDNNNVCEELTGFVNCGHQYYQLITHHNNKTHVKLFRDDYYVWHMDIHDVA